jgi:hypothetical protein
MTQICREGGSKGASSSSDLPEDIPRIEIVTLKIVNLAREGYARLSGREEEP